MEREKESGTKRKEQKEWEGERWRHRGAKHNKTGERVERKRENKMNVLSVLWGCRGHLYTLHPVAENLLLPRWNRNIFFQYSTAKVNRTHCIGFKAYTTLY